MPGGKQLRLGPFIGGLNTGSDPTAIADAELAECVNYELDIDGSLVSRPPIQELDGHINFTERIVLLCEAIFSGNRYIIGSNVNGVFHYLNGVWTLITSTFRASVAVQYADKVYLVAHPSSVNPGGKWDPVGGFTAVAAIPKGQGAVIHKERLFVVPGKEATTNTSRLTFSDPGNFDTWPGSNFIDIGQGDGTQLIDLTVYQDNLLLFKSQNAYVLAYDIRPTDAVVRKISQTIGVESQNCLVNYENQVYVLYNGWVYEIVNYDFHRLNTKTPFILDQTAPSPFSSESVCMSILGDRLVVRFYNKTYVYGLRTRTWAEWESSEPRLHYFGPIVTLHQDTGDEFYAGSAIAAFKTLIKLIDIQTATDVEKVVDPTLSTRDTFTRTTSNGWGNADTGEAWTPSPASAFSTNGSKGVISLAAVSSPAGIVIDRTLVDSDVLVTISPTVVATGTAPGQILVQIDTRRVDDNNKYHCRVFFEPGGTQVRFELLKIVAGVETTIGAAISFGSYVANEEFKVRFRVVSTNIKARLWRPAAGTEPGGWHFNITDSSISSAGNSAVRAMLTANNTNTLPVLVNFDDFSVANTADVKRDITCHVKTKNFDMAVSSQFKKLWWWGADVTSNRDILGTASPIVVSFNVKWSDLATKAWNTLKTWSQPLTEITAVATVVATGTGTARRFAKFNKALRYRQINFQVQLLTDGSTTDGPARLFTIMIVTETKQGVSKAVT